MDKFSDYIVVGGGASGCALTNKLLSANKSVTLIEAGYSHHNFLLDVPAGFFKLINDSKYATYYKTKPQDHLAGRENIIPQGNVLGGGTSINAQVYMRGRAEDYNEWDEILRVNNDGANWSWDTVLPYFREMENNSRLNNKYHSNKGNLNVSDSPYVDQLSYDFIDSVALLGVDKTDDFNGEHQKGVGLYQFMNRKGKRSSSAYAFIENHLNNPLLNLLLETTVKEIIIENQVAIGVVIVNNVAGGAISMGEGADDASNTPPSVMVSQDIGEDIISALLSGESISASLLDTSGFDLDGSFDNGIVAHEYGHGISIRLTGGASSTNCLQNAEQMGEGWSDWFGLMITMEEGDQSTDPRGIGNFASGVPLGESGLSTRRAPYSTDFSINDYTYGDSNNSAQITQPHGLGFVFATMLWDLTWAYVDKYGFDSDLFNGNGGNNKVMQLVLDGLKLQSCSPGFVDGRDAILAADMASTGGQNQCLIWEVFANRGLGYNASQGDSGNRTDQVEDFNLPPDEDPTLENCEVLSLENTTNLASVYPNPSNGLVSISSEYINGQTTVQLIDINGRQVFNKKYNFENKINLNFENISSGIYIL